MSIANDNAITVAKARRLLGVKGHAPDRKVLFEAAMALYQADYALIRLIKDNELATVNDLFNAGRAENGWYLYWMSYHPDEEERERCGDAYLEGVEVLQRYANDCTDV